MKIIKLPAILPGNLDLEKINQQLRGRTAQLDWSAVVSASDQSLNTLLAGLDLSDDADVLGDSTLSETIASKIVQVLQEQPEPTKTKPSKPTEPKTAPAIWQQSNLLQPQFVATDQEQSEEQRIRNKVKGKAL